MKSHYLRTEWIQKYIIVKFAFFLLFISDKCGPRVPSPSSGEQPLPHRGERVCPEEGSKVQRAHHTL